MIHFLFSASSANPRRPDEMFTDQWDAVTLADFSASVCSDAVVAGVKPLRDIPSGSQVVYRGWMLKGGEYASLVHAIEESGTSALTSPQNYMRAHHLPNWYPLLTDLTPETHFFPADANLATVLQSLDWEAYFIKDYVKSLKTGRGAIARTPAEAAAIIEEMKEYRGEIEGGICVRRVEDFIPQSETRYAALHGVAYSPTKASIPDPVQRCAERIPCPFFSVDAAERRNGVLRVVEIGDGQVSDIVGWSPTRFR